MDGAPVRGESIPVRLFLGGFDLTPSYRNVHNKFSVKYYLNLVLIDEDDRRYFKQQEVTLWRKAPAKLLQQKSFTASNMRYDKQADKPAQAPSENEEKDETPTPTGDDL